MLKIIIIITIILLNASVILLSYVSISNGSTSESQSIESSSIANNFSIKEYSVPPGSHPHDVAPIITNQDYKNNNTIAGLLLKQQVSWANLIKQVAKHILYHLDKDQRLMV